MRTQKKNLPIWPVKQDSMQDKSGFENPTTPNIEISFAIFILNYRERLYFSVLLCNT